MNNVIRVGLLFCLLILIVIPGVNGKITRVCVNNSIDFPPANLSCNEGQMIHVQSIRYYNDVNKCEDHLDNTQLSDQPLNESSLRLVTDCNGHRTCNLTRSSFSGNLYAVVKYRCINFTASKVDMCQNIHLNLTNMTDIFLSSPQYPSSPGLNGKPKCECFITGHKISSIQILELMLKKTASLVIQNGNISHIYNASNNSRIYNRRITMQKNTTNVTIIFNHQQYSQQKLWIELTGQSLTYNCKLQPEVRTATTTEFASTNPEQTLETTDTHTKMTAVDDDTSSTAITDTVATVTLVSSTNGSLSTNVDFHTSDSVTASGFLTKVVSGSVTALVVVAVVVIIVLVLLLRRSRKNQQISKASEENVDKSPVYFTIESLNECETNRLQVWHNDGYDEYAEISLRELNDAETNRNDANNSVTKCDRNPFHSPDYVSDRDSTNVEADHYASIDKDDSEMKSTEQPGDVIIDVNVLYVPFELDRLSASFAEFNNHENSDPEAVQIVDNTEKERTGLSEIRIVDHSNTDVRLSCTFESPISKCDTFI